MPATDPILLTGATGVLGLAVVKRLLADGHRLRTLVRDPAKAATLLPASVELVQGSLQDVVALDQAVAGCRACIHLAGLVSFDDRDQQHLLETNYEGTRSLANACLDKGVGHLIHISSVAAFTQAKADEQTVPRPGQHASYYGYTKRLAELEVHRTAAEGLPFTILRPSVVLGRHPDRRSSSAMLRVAGRGWTAIPPGTLHWVAVDDVADAVAAAILRGPENRTWVLDAEPTTWRTFFELYRSQAAIRGRAWRLSPGALRTIAPFSSFFGRLLGLPIPGRRQLLNFLEDRPYPGRETAIELLGHPYRTLDEAINSLIASSIQHPTSSL